MTTESDELIQACIQVCLEHNKGSASLLQRHLKIGYTRASRILEHLESIGLVGPRLASNRPGEFLARIILKPMPKTCEGCKFWNSDGAVQGDCRRHAPTIGPERTGWPTTFSTDFCGDHQFKINLQP